MRLTAVLLSYPPARWVGAELGTHTLLKHLQRQGWAVRVRSEAAERGYTYDGIRVAPRGTPLGGEDVVLTHAYRSPVLLAPVREARARAGRRGVLVVLMAHNARAHTASALREIGPDLVVANSWTTARVLGTPIEHVVRPPLEMPGGKAGVAAAALAAVDRPMVAGYVNSAALKGGEALAGLAAARQGQGLSYGLLGVTGGYGDQMAPGEDPIPRAEMAARYFRRIKVHLQPSLEESWGMVNLEALVEGCAVVTSDLPGVREGLLKVPERWIGWLPRGAPAGELDAVVRDVLGREPPTEREAKALASALWKTSMAGRGDRERMSRTLRRMAERPRLHV